MMNSWLVKIIFAIQLCLLAGSTSADLNKATKYLQLGCSDWKPYCYKYNNQLRGPLIDISQSVMDEAGFEYTIEIFPWNRVYKLGLKQPDFLILGLGRTAKREGLFKWIAPLKNPSKILAYQNAESDFSLVNADDLKNYSIAVERGSYTHEYLIERGHDEEKIIVISRYEQLYKMVLSGRTQLLLMDSKSFRPEAVRNGFDPDSFKPSILAFTVTEYLATGLGTSDDVVEKLKSSYADLVKQGKIDLPD